MSYYPLIYPSATCYLPMSSHSFFSATHFSTTYLPHPSSLLPTNCLHLHRQELLPQNYTFSSIKRPIPPDLSLFAFIIYRPSKRKWFNTILSSNRTLFSFARVIAHSNSATFCIRLVADFRNIFFSVCFRW